MSKGTMEKTMPEEKLYNQLLHYKRLLSVAVTRGARSRRKIAKTSSTKSEARSWKDH